MMIELNIMSTTKSAHINIDNIIRIVDAEGNGKTWTDIFFSDGSRLSTEETRKEIVLKIKAVQKKVSNNKKLHLFEMLHNTLINFYILFIKSSVLQFPGHKPDTVNAFILITIDRHRRTTTFQHYYITYF